MASAVGGRSHGGRAVEARAHCVAPHEPVIAYGASMGGNASGLAVADSDVFDWWVAVEGAHNVTETYLEAKLLAPANAYAAGAVAAIEAEMDGTIAQAPEAYAEHTNVLRVADIAAHVQGVVLVHGVADGLVPYNQSREMQAALKRRQIPVDLFTHIRRSPDAEPGTTIDGYVPTGQVSPFAGHGFEGDATHDVIATGFEHLAALLGGQTPADCEVVIDAEDQSPSICKPNAST